MSAASISIGGGVRRCPNAKDELMSNPFPEEPSVCTSYHILKRSASQYAQNNFLGHREKLPDQSVGEYKWKKYSDVFADISKYGVGLQQVCGLKSGKTGSDQTRIGIYSVNRPEALEAVLAIWSRRAVAVPFYDSLIPDAVTYLIDHAELTIVFVERSKLQNLINGKGTNGKLKYVVLFESPTDEERSACQAKGLTLTSLPQLAAAAEGHDLAAEEPTADDWAYVMYTSGTTGSPKGVILLHRNLLASALGANRGIYADNSPFLRPDDIYISYLPMAHIFEVNMLITMLMCGASVGFFQGDVRKLVTEDIPKLQPTFMAGVPRVFNRFFDKVMQSIEAKGAVAKLLFQTGFDNQLWLMSTLGVRNPLWDLLVFNNIRQALGGKLRFVVSGAAPLSVNVHKFLRVCLGCTVVQGFGMTETAAATTIQFSNSKTFGNIGGPSPTCEIKLVDSDDYKTNDVYPKTAAEFEKQVSFKGEFDPEMAGKVVERGEMWIRGHNIFAGYFKMEKETKDALDSEKWLHTGDIAQWEPDGSIRIIDRKKDIFKLAQGEYVSPESVEAGVVASKWVIQAWVYGSSLETSLVAVIVPDMEILRPWIASQNLEGTVDEVCNKQEVKNMIMEDIIKCCRSAKLRSFEIPAEIAFVTQVNELGQGFTIESECITPTFKLRRPQLLKKYQSLIDACYAQIKAREAPVA